MSSERDELRFKVFTAAIALHSVLGTCDRLRTASGAIKDNRLRGVGFNGSVSGLPHCDDVDHLMVEGHCVRTRHGEVNLISNTDREHLKGAKVIVMGTPCFECIKDLAQEGVAEIHVIGQYSNSFGKEHIVELCRDKHIQLVQHSIDIADLFQGLFNEMTKKGGLLHRAGYRLKVVAEEL